MQQLEKEELAKQDQTDGNHRSRFKKCSEVLDHEERWITYAEQALSLLNHEVMWQGIVEACKILKYPEPSATHRDYFETLLICHVLFGFRYILNQKEQSVLAILLTILFVCVN